MLSVLMPSRGRERQATEAYQAFLDTKTRRDTELWIVLTEGEPGYADLPTITVAEGGGMGAPLNAALSHVETAEVVGFIGDDHRFRTESWDVSILSANFLIDGGIIYGNDLLRGEELPSQVFIDGRIIRALGWMALPGASHLYLDDTWLSLGRGLDRLVYLPDVVIEHLHFTAGKSEMDEGYRRVNDHGVYQHDARIFEQWVNEYREADLDKVRVALQ